ncbi:hypothetical protein GCK72_000265 [Caenorhabditis remanei]|uniref:DMAP1-binding domain-containing protein n=1 Tax=Caenorhabditis remanei TaxID=31234 RepID=A0A6A5HQB5_CAERE|nr:hypothetical protein GCK72_000265 [Caenorhabditis remanei]KAF1768453.1 hypothetical protein GCK72_000265 [Caenorhabditis remanei]
MIIAVTSVPASVARNPHKATPPLSPKFEANVGYPPAQRSPSTPSAHRRVFPPPPSPTTRRPASQLPPSPKLSRSTPKMVARKAMGAGAPPTSPSMSSPQITRLRVNGRVVRVTAIRQSAYYSSSEDEDSINGGTLGKKDGTLTRPPQTAPRTSSLLSNKKKETPSTTTSSNAVPPPPISKNTAERRSGTRKERAVEDMLRLVQENRDRHDQQKKDYGEYVQARIRPKAPSGEVIRVSRQDYRNSKIIVTDGEAIRISPHREEIETTIEESTSLHDHHHDHDDEAVYVNTTIGGGNNGGSHGRIPDSPGDDYQNAVLPLKQTKVSSKIQNVVNALQTVSSTGPSLFSPASRKLSSENHKEYLAQLHSRKAVSLKEKKVKQQRSAEEGYASASPSTASLVPSRPPLPKYHHVCEPSYGDEDDILLDDGATVTSSVDFVPGFVRRATRSSEQIRRHRDFVSNSCSAPSTSSGEEYEWSFVRRQSTEQEEREMKNEEDEMTIGWTRRQHRFKKWKLNQTIHELARPRSKPLQDYYNDDDAELEAMAKIRDPEAPRPEGTIMNPVRGEAAHSNTNNTMPRSLDSAFHRFGTTAAKNVAAMVLDQSAKPSTQLTYGKLHSRAGKVAHMLLTKTVQINKDGTKNCMCKPGDRVALIYPNTQPLHFLAAFYGCLQAGVIPVPVEMPSSKREAGIAQLGFLLGNCGVKVALTSESCYKGLPKKVNTSSVFSAPSGSTSLTGTANEIVDFRGWPRLWWAVTEHMSKPARDWTAPPRLADETIAYIEYTTGNDGTVKGVCVTRQAVFAHCRALTTAMEYKEDETMVCVVDFKREVGLWHAILASVFNGMRVIFVPYSLMKMNPATWMHMVSKYQATTALVKSRDLHWALLATRDHKDISLSSLRTLLVADGANPWSLSSCDAFAAAFSPAPYNLRPDAMCPCAGSSETGTISIRRRGNAQLGSQSGRGVLSMSALSHCVVRVDQENSLTSLTLQDAGQIVAGAVVVVTAIDGSNRLCQADEIGEICVSANSTAQLYWALDGQTQHTFKVEPIGEYGKPIGAVRYVRSGLIGFMGPDGMVFVVARRQSLLAVSGRYHSADDIIATVLAVEPMKFVYRGRICVFSTSVLRDERIVIVAEQKPNCSEEEAFDWITRVLRAIDTIHQVGIYCCALVPANHLPKTPLGGVHVSETKQRFENGDLHPSTLLMCPHNCVLNLPKPRERQADVGPAAMFVGNIVQGVRIAVAKGRNIDDEPSLPLLECLRSRAQTSPDHRILTLVTAKNAEQDTATCATLLKRAERIAGLLTDRARLSRGDHVALIFPPSIDLVAAFFGCLSAGLVPVCIRPPVASDLNTTLGPIRMMVDMSKAVAILAPANVSKLLKSKEAAHSIDSNAWPMILDLEDAPSSWRRKNTVASDTTTSGSSGAASKDEICYLDFSINSSGQLQGSSMSEASAITVCKSVKVSSELYPSRHVVVCAPPYSGISLVLWCLSSVYSGHHTTLIPPSEVDAQPSLFLTTLSNLKVRDAFTTYSTINSCVTQLATSVESLKERGCNLAMLRSCVAIAEERPRIALMNSFCKLFAPLALNNRAISTSFSSRVNAAICMQGASGPEPSTVYVDARALRNDRISLVGKGAPHSVALIESGKLLPGVKIAIANPETRGQCADSHLGEIWVASVHNASPLNRTGGAAFTEEVNTDVYNARLTTGDTKTRWARTGYLGFLRQTQSITEHGELHDAVFVVGALNESLVLRGMRYHPFDVESTVSKAHRFVGNSAVFTWNHLVVIAAECTGTESDALDLVPAITSAVLEEHHLIVGVVVVVDPGSIRHGPGGEKLRSTIRSLFLEEKLNPIYVAYHM